MARVALTRAMLHERLYKLNDPERHEVLAHDAALRTREAKLAKALTEIAAIECIEDHDELNVPCPSRIARLALLAEVKK